MHWTISTGERYDNRTMESVITKGCFLIAGPALYDPNFRQSVVLLCEHNDQGSMGLIINRPTELVLAEALHQLSIADHHDLVYSGGPVQPDHLLVLIRAHEQPTLSHHVFNDVYMGTDLPTLQSLAAHALPGETFRGYAGYAGWGGGQLDSELETGSWITIPADSKWIFDADPAAVWPELMRSLGPRYAFYASMPKDPTLN